MRKFSHYFFVLVALGACEEKIDIDIVAEKLDLLVVEGVLTNERKNHRITLTLPYQEQNATPQPASGALVSIREDNLTYVLDELPAGSGYYYTPPLLAVSGKKYTLRITYQGREYVAEDSSVPVQPMQPLSYRKESEGYALNLGPSGVDANYVEHVVTWENTSSCMAGTACQSKIVFYDLKTIDVNEIFKPAREEFHFPEQSSVTRRKYSVSAAYREFLRSMLSETQWRGGVFDVQRAHVPTNLSDGAIGFFAVCAVVSDSTVVK